LQEVGALDPAAIAEVRADAWPDVRDADELADTLHTLIAVPENFVPPDRRSPAEAWRGYFNSLRESNRASRAKLGKPAQPGAAVPHDSDVWFWVSAEKAKAFTAIYPDAQFEDQLPTVEGEAPLQEEALKAMVTGWLTHLGPTNATSLAGLLHLPLSEIDKTLLRIETSGLILRGTFDKTLGEETQWSERRLLARIHRLTLGTLRKQIEPVTSAMFMRWLLRWQHVSPGTQARAEHGTLQVLRQLQGFEVPASAWERHILARRISNYDPQVLDQLCLTGAVGWGRLTPHPAMLEDSSGEGRRVVPTSVAPITFFVRDEAEWMALPSVKSAHRDAEQEVRGLGAGAREVLTFLRTRGASFFADIVRGTDKLKAEIETALWELVAAGLVTADGFDNLRALIDPKRRAGQGSGKSNRPRHSAGRWSLLYPPHGEDSGRAIESVCRVLLERYGVVFRELLVRESMLPRWRDMLISFRRLEDRGEIRGGRFINGFIGEQFALPVAVESLRAMKSLPPTDEIITISAADPLNLAGIVVPGERVPAISGKHVSFKDGVLVDTPETPILSMVGRV
jgi:ATP-dependent Lhr-like helicase